MKKQLELYTGESVEIGGVRVKCEKAISHRAGGGPPRHGVVLVYDEQEQVKEGAEETDGDLEGENGEGE